MSLAPIFPLFNPAAQEDLKVKFFSILPISDLCSASQVCKAWFQLAREKVIWVPIFKQLNPFLKREFNLNVEENIKSEVLADLQKNQKRVDLILSLIDEDDQLASFIDNSSISLANLRKMLPMERTMHVMRGLRKDCTQFLVYLPEKHISDWEKELQKKYTTRHFSEGLLMKITSDYYQVEKSLPCLLVLVKDPLGPFDASQVLTAAASLLNSAPALEKTVHIFAAIVKSHQNLFTFFEQRMNIGNDQIGNHFISMKSIVHTTLIPEMEKFGIDVTMDDWIKCGLLRDSPK